MIKAGILLTTLTIFTWDATTSSPRFQAVPADKSGIRWTHDNALSPERYLPESMGPGTAIFDFNNDGWMDLYFVNSGLCDFYTPSRPLRNALYRNNKDGTFSDVTEPAGVAGGKFGIGVFAADFDGDGWTDLYLTNYGSNTLYRNNGDATFSDVASKSGLEAPGLNTAAVWFDYDGDGKLDLYVGHFVRYNKNLEKKCLEAGTRHYCYPIAYEPWASRLFHNNGNGFEDVSAASGIGKHLGKAFGAVATDIDLDGRLDLFVANDSVANFLFWNRGQGRFDEIGISAEVAYNSDGAARSGMGVDAADYDDDGRQDLFVCNFNREKFSIYRNLGNRVFSDEAGPTGIGMATHMYSGWGVKFFDFDHDGDQDLIVTNGHPDDLIEQISTTLTHKEPLLLFVNGAARFQNLGERAGEVFAKHHPGRGLAVGDLNNDGSQDVVVANNGEPPLILYNTGASGNHWLGLRLIGETANRDAVGASIAWSTGGTRRTYLKNAGGSYLSSNDPRLVLGLGRESKAEWVEVRWPAPSKRVDRFENVAGDRYYTLREGQGLR
jgi:enediyne biosynthesis protein E4